MKKLYFIFHFSIIVSLFTSVANAQCDGITLASLSNPGPYQVATLTEANGIRNGPNYFGGTIYYPTNATPPYASIAIVPGFSALPSSVQDWGPFYASHGIVTIIIGTNSIYDFPEARATALLDALETIRQENIRAASPLLGALNLNQLAVSGWSMGGGGAQRAAVLDNTIAGVVALCPYLTSPQLNHTSPVLIFSGQADTVAPPSQHANVHYNATPNTTDKLLFEISNGNHSVANTPTGGNGVIGKIALSWLKLNVEGNNCYCPLLKDALLVNPPAASNVAQNFGCSTLEINKHQIKIGFYPNPTKGIVNIEISEDVHYQIISTLGQLLLEGNLTGGNKQIDLSQFPASIYYLSIEGQIIKLIKNN
jgi:dienelactone hydrolase